MALQINIIPNIANNGSGMPTTTIELDIDVSTLMEMLKIYDLLLKTKMTVNSVNVSTNVEEKNIYEFAQIYKNVDSPTITISTIVWGNITDENSVECIAEGVFVNKEQ